ncbi:MAG: thiamine-phosphate pyrophosphorylase [Candidatus Omnitrophica bacterium]|nr:thiamine-phosphate pyrophosphorylase [Candidatus Omnitrophota bacterium]MCM8790303.1 thiamine-phosphate pyrophosphorylase [Candidatus Omnitrophota bacterium]
MVVKKDVFRIIDANFNRCREGLRVCEDIIRFTLGCAQITKELKAVRHDVSSAIGSSAATSRLLLESRNAKKDIGRLPQPDIESTRKDYVDIFIANMQRVKESLRVLEEFFKLIDMNLSLRFLRLRFRIYDIEKRAARRLVSSRCRNRRAA